MKPHKKPHNIHCLECGKTFSGTGQTVFCSKKCIEKFNAHEENCSICNEE